MARYSRNDQAGVELPKAKLDRESLRQALELFQYLRPYRARFGAALAAMFLASLLSLAFPYLAEYPSEHPPSVLGGHHRPSHPKRGCAKWPAMSPWIRWAFSCGCRYLLQDRDTKFTHGFGQILAAAGVESVRLPPRSVGCPQRTTTRKGDRFRGLIRRHLKRKSGSYGPVIHEESSTGGGRVRGRATTPTRIKPGLPQWGQSRGGASRWTSGRMGSGGGVVISALPTAWPLGRS